METIGNVLQLWRYPASSLAGETRPDLEVDATGATGDRLYGVVDAETGEPARPDRDRRWHPAPRIRTRLRGDGRLEVAVPGGSWMEAPSQDCDRVLSDHFGLGVSLRPFGGTDLPGYDGPQTEPRYAKAPIHLLTTASLARLQALNPAGVADARRFRPNVVVDMPAVEGSFPETEWIGRRIAVGEVEMTISEPCRRCGFTIIAQDGFDDDPGILRSLVRHNGHDIGVYCTVDRPGRMALGDGLRFL
ncbi:MAG: MOSC domain-containing protein [Rhizobiaceae bacterium]|nr:MOSC domain-containing protein [Rhizobiaceae bacterium]